MSGRAGNRHAQIIRLYDEASVEVRRVLFRKLGNQQEADEIAQDAFEKLCRLSNRGEIRDIRKYYFTMANRLALNALRRRNLENGYLANPGPTTGEENEASTLEDPARALAVSQRLTIVKRAIMDLPPKTRHVFLLHRFDACTYVDIAKQLGISKKAVEYHMRRALSAITTCLDAEQ